MGKRLQLHLGRLPERCTEHLLRHAPRRGFSVDELRGIGAAHDVWKRITELAPYAKHLQQRAEASPFDAAVAHIEWSGLIQGIRRAECRQHPCDDDPAERLFAVVSQSTGARPMLWHPQPNDIARSHILGKIWRAQTDTAALPEMCINALGAALERIPAADCGVLALDDQAVITHLRLRMAVAESAHLPLALTFRQAHTIDTVHAVALRGWLLGTTLHLPTPYGHFIRTHIATLMTRALRCRLRFLTDIPDALAQKQKALHAFADAAASTDPDYAESLRAQESTIVSLALLRDSSIGSAIDWMIGA